MEEDGFPIYLHDSSTGAIYKLNERFSQELLQLEIKNCYIKEFFSDKET